jgi:hypothetical protein
MSIDGKFANFAIVHAEHGFILTHGWLHEWLDFNTGRVIVNLLPNASSTIQ